MNATALSTRPSVDVYRRRGFQVVSRLARMEVAPGRHGADPHEGPDRDARDDDYAPRHRQEEPSSFLLPLVVG